MQRPQRQVEQYGLKEELSRGCYCCQHDDVRRGHLVVMSGRGEGDVAHIIAGDF